MVDFACEDEVVDLAAIESSNALVEGALVDGSVEFDLLGHLRVEKMVFVGNSLLG